MTSRPTNRRLLLIGAGYTGTLVAAELARRADGPVLVAILDDNATRHGERIGNVPILGPVTALSEVAQGLAVDEVVIAIPSLSGGRLRDIVTACRAAGLPVRTMPSIVELLGRAITPRQLRPVEVADLLRRTEARCDEAPPSYLSGSGCSLPEPAAR